jgi:hypothetical protein
MVTGTGKKATTKAKMRRKTVPLGDVRRDSGGIVTMIELNEYRPNPGAPQILVNKVGGIYRVSANILKVTFVLATPTLTGAPETIERVSLLWEEPDVHEANEQFTWAFREIRRGTFHAAVTDDGGGRRGPGRH